VVYAIMIDLVGGTEMELCVCESLHAAMALLEKLLSVEQPKYSYVTIRIQRNR
jgi:hypothetical protein